MTASGRGGCGWAYGLVAVAATGLCMLPHHGPRTTVATTTVQTPPPPAAPRLEEVVARAETPRTRSIQHECLARAVYFEARGDRDIGQIAVAQTIVNRTRSDIFPDTPCAVIRQKGQFSFVHHGALPQADRTSTAWRRAVAIASIVLHGGWRTRADDALFFHARTVDPRWTRQRIGLIGQHIFYR